MTPLRAATCALLVLLFLVSAAAEPPCNCERCTEVERASWTLVGTRIFKPGQQCFCEYHFVGEEAWTRTYACDEWWFKARYCKLPLPSLGLYGEDGKTRLGGWSMPNDCNTCNDGVCTMLFCGHIWKDRYDDCGDEDKRHF